MIKRVLYMETRSKEAIPLLETQDVSKRFSGFWALKGVNLRVQDRTTLAIIGPNGAGKTTLFNVLTRFIPVTGGRILYDGIDITNEAPYRLARHGLVRSFQISAVFASLSVLENVIVALQKRSGSAGSFWRSSEKQKELEESAMALLGRVGLDGAAGTTTANLPYGSRRALEIATTLAMEPRILLLDEPTAGMGPEDVSRIADLLDGLKATHTLILVEHNLGVVAELADSIAVLNFGEILIEGTYSQITSNKQVMAAYLGRDGG